MLSALILLTHASTAPRRASDGLDPAGARRARAMADFLQLYGPSVLLAAPGRACADTLAPLASRLGLAVETRADLSADLPKFPGGGGSAHAAAWLASRALRVLPDPRRTAVVCAEAPVLAALLVAIAARDDHDLSAYDLTLPLETGGPDHPPGGGWILHRDDGRVTDLKPLARR